MAQHLRTTFNINQHRRIERFMHCWKWDNQSHFMNVFRLKPRKTPSAHFPFRIDWDGSLALKLTYALLPAAPRHKKENNNAQSHSSLLGLLRHLPQPTRSTQPGPQARILLSVDCSIESVPGFFHKPYPSHSCSLSFPFVVLYLTNRYHHPVIAAPAASVLSFSPSKVVRMHVVNPLYLSKF